jgi:hypothetical protein
MVEFQFVNNISRRGGTFIKYKLLNIVMNVVEMPDRLKSKNIGVAS